MKISSIVDIVYGTLQNDPAISFITQQHTDVTKVNDGDLFISSCVDDIKTAISKGAFAIIHDIDTNINNLDNEIALIKVNNINNAIIKLIRYNLINKKIHTYFIDDICINILQNILLSKQNIIILNNNLIANFELLTNIDSEMIILSSNKELLSNINPKNNIFNIDTFELKNITIHSLFETSFSYNSKYFYKLKLSYLYVDYFLNIIKFLEKFNIKFDIQRIANIKYMNPIFINKNSLIVEFGKSNQFIISNNIEQTVQEELNFINKHYKYGTKIVIDGFCEDSELYIKIKNTNCNAIYIINRTQHDIIDLLNKNSNKPARLF